MPFYRYVSTLETSYVKVHGRVPNVDHLGVPKTVYFTDALFVSASIAETELRIGKFHPAGSRLSPTDRFDLDLTGISYIGPTVIVGSPSGMNEFVTSGSPSVSLITALLP